MKLNDRQSTYHAGVEMPRRSPFVNDTFEHLGKVFAKRKSQKIELYFLAALANLQQM